MSLENEQAAAPAESPAVEASQDMTVDEMVQERAQKREAEREAAEAVDVTEEEQTQPAEALEGDTVDEETEAVETVEEDAEAETVEADEEYEEVEADTPSIDPPQFYSAEMKAQFATLDPVSQAHIVQLTKQGEAFVSQTTQKMRDEARDATRTKLTQFDEAIATAKALGAKKFATDVELSQLIQSGQTTEAQAYAHQLERNAFEQSVSQMEQAKTQEEANWVQQNIQARTTELKTRNPKVLDDAPIVMAFATRQGRTQDEINAASSTDLETLWMAAKYEQSLKAAKKVKRAPKRPAKVIKPTRGKTSASPQSAEISKLKRRADQTGDIEDVLAHRRAVRKAAKS